MLVLAAYVLSKGDRYSLYSAAADGLRRSHETLGVPIIDTLSQSHHCCH